MNGLQMVTPPLQIALKLGPTFAEKHIRQLQIERCHILFNL